MKFFKKHKNITLLLIVIVLFIFVYFYMTKIMKNVDNKAIYGDRLKVVENVKSEVSVKIRANVDGVDTLDVAGVIDDAGADYLHIDAMKKGVFDADYNLVNEICDNTNIKVIGNNSMNCEKNIEKMINSGVYGFSIARAVISGNLDFNISQF